MARKGGQIFINIVGDSASAERAFERLQRELTGLGRGVEKAGRRMGDGFLDAGRKMSQAGSTLTRNVTLPIVGLGAVAVKSFADFDSAMTQSTAIMGDLSTDMRKKMETTAREVAKTTTFSAQQAAESYFFLASAGLDAQQSITAMPRVAAFAQAGMFDMARATDLLTDAQSALGLVAKDAQTNLTNLTRVSDVLVKANILSNASVEQFSEALTNKAGTAARALGKSVEETAAVLAAFAAQGVKGSEAGEALNIVWRDLQRAAIKNEKEFRKFGVSVFDSSGNMRNTAAIVADLENALKGMSDKQKRATLTTLGFQDKSVSNLITLLGTSDAIRGYERDLRKAGNTTEQVAKKQLDTPAERLKNLRDQLVDVAIDVGPKLIGPIEKLAKSFAKVVGVFSKLPEPLQNAALMSAAFGASLGPLLKLTGGVTTGVGKFLNVLDKAKKGEGLLATLGRTGTRVFALLKTGILSLGRAFAMAGTFLMANPIFLVIAALVAAGVAIFVFRDKIMTALKAVGRFFVAVWDKIKGFVIPVWHALKAAGIAIFNALKVYFRAVAWVWRNIFVNAWNKIKGIVIPIWNALMKAGRWIFEKLGRYIKAGIIATQRMFEKYGRSINVLKEIFVRAFNIVKTVVTTAVNAVVSAFKFAMKPVQAFIGAVGKAIDIAGKVGGGIKAGFKAVTPFASGGTARRGQLALVGEEGPELVRFGARAHITPARETRQMLAPTGTDGRGGDVYTFYVTNPKPEPVSATVPRALRRAAFMRGR